MRSNAEKFEEITRRPGYEKVLEGIKAAQEVGFDPVKVNAVSIRGMTEAEIVPFGHFARETGVEIRFIEYMPLDADNAWERDKVLFASRDHRHAVARDHAAGPGRRSESARSRDRFRVRGRRRPDRLHPVGQPAVLLAVQPVPHHGRRQAAQLPVQPGGDGRPRHCCAAAHRMQEIVAAVRASVAAKWAGHHINHPDFVQPDRPMHSIGG